MGKYDLGALFDKEPAVIAGAIKSVLFVVVLAGLVVVDAELLAGIALAVEVVLTLFLRQSVTPTAAPTLAAGTEVKVAGTEETSIV